MSVIVKGLDLPAYKEGYKNRYVCLLVQNSDGITDLYVADKKYPVSTVPTPHGRLIDAEELSKVFDWKQLENSPDEKGQTLYLLGQATIEAIREVPTIIETEVSE